MAIAMFNPCRPCCKPSGIFVPCCPNALPATIHATMHGFLPQAPDGGLNGAVLTLTYQAGQAGVWDVTDQLIAGYHVGITLACQPGHTFWLGYVTINGSPDPFNGLGTQVQPPVCDPLLVWLVFYGPSSVSFTA